MTTAVGQDYLLVDHGSLVILTALTAEARDYLDERMPDDAPRWAGGYAVEPRFVCDILADLIDNGFTVGGDS